MGHSVNLISLELEDWKDEFASDEPKYFTMCVQLQNSSAHGEDGMPRLAVAGLANVRNIILGNRRIRPISPAFTQHQWPNVVEFSCTR